MSEQYLRHWVFERYIPCNLKIRDPRTKTHYRRALDNFSELLGHEPTLGDLTDDNLSAFILYLLDARKLAESTANERAGRLRAFWNWAAKKRLVDQEPTFAFIDEPEKLPRAWRENELVRISNACRMQRGDICGIPAWRWWLCLHAFLWFSGERIGATMAMRVEHLRLDEGTAEVPANIRKGKKKPKLHELPIDLVEMLRQILPPIGPERELVFPWPKAPTTIYHHYQRVLRLAGLPFDRSCKFQRMRVSHASWTHFNGQDATSSLGHSDPATTRKHYLDPSLLRQDQSKLFRPW